MGRCIRQKGESQKGAWWQPNEDKHVTKKIGECGEPEFAQIVSSVTFNQTQYICAQAALT